MGYRPEDIVIMGDSAGGNLGFVLMLWLRDNPEMVRLEFLDSVVVDIVNCINALVGCFVLKDMLFVVTGTWHAWRCRSHVPVA